MSDNIKVVVKVRPLISREIEDKLFHQWRVKNNTIYQVDQNGKDCGNAFTFDKVYDENTKTTDVYNDVAKPIVEAATAGFNGTIFAYGQTSSGKTYTMTGTEESPGIIPLAVINLFDIIKTLPGRDFLVRVSYVEIYNETLIDLLNTEKKNIKIHDTLQGVKVDATVKVTTSPEEVLQFMREGQANRQTGSTNMNEESSRSHSIFQIIIESREHTEGEDVGCLNVSQLNLVDLAGSERSGQTGATGIRFKEGTHINKSLSSLALVIKQLSEGLSKHVNYRDSKLTRILQNSLGGNAKTSIICAITPAALEETISTLQFACRAKAIKNTPEVNVVATDSKMIDSLTKQLSLLKTQLESKRNLEEDNQKLQKQISVLQRFLSGFGQRSSNEMMAGNRRKIQQLRRATISTPHHIQEEPVPSAQRFCTPSLKYNPMLVGSSSEFQPIQNASGLASVPEEPAVLVTPPRDKRLTNNDEVIELDSDDDVPVNLPTCSPYHKCFESSKTPPCVLRKNAIEAEKNFRDLVELTGREKIYSPNVVELIEKLEKNTSVIAKLEEEVNILKKENKSEVEILSAKINKTEEEVRNLTSNKLQLEALCKDYETKLTDWEVTYDTLKKKARTREEELLLRLEEFESNNKTGKPTGIAAYHDTSKDGSTASTNASQPDQHSEECIASANIESELMSVELVMDLKEQLKTRDKALVELETSLHAQNQKISFLESKTHEFEKLLNSCEQKLLTSEEENSLHKSTINTLNSIIENQKSNLESASIDIESYNNTIQELQEELNKKQNIKITLDSAEIQSLILSEEKIIANNENICNIIRSMQVALDSKNREIEDLKSISLRNETSEKYNTLTVEVENKQAQIIELREKIQTMILELDGNNSQIEKLLSERNALLASQLELGNKLSESQKREDELANKIKDLETELKILKDNNEELINSLKDNKSIENEFIAKISMLNDQVINYLSRIENLEKDLIRKDAQISSIIQNNNIKENKYLYTIKEAISNLLDLLLPFTSENNGYQNKNNSSLELPIILDDMLNKLNNAIVEMINEKTSLMKENLEGRTTITNWVKLVVTEITSINTEIETLHSINSTYDINGSISNKMPSEINPSKDKIHFENDKILGVMENVIEDIEKQPQLTEVKKLFIDLKEKILNITSKSQSSFVEVTQLLQARCSEIEELNLKLNSLKADLDDKSQQILCLLEEKKVTVKEWDENVHNITLGLTKIGCELNIESNISSQLENKYKHTTNQIITMLDHILCNIIELKSIHLIEVSTKEKMIGDAEEEIRTLTQHNVKLTNNVTQVNRINSDLSLELKELQLNSKALSEDLKVSSELLNELKEELRIKVDEIECMENKVLRFKSQFSNLEILMKKQQNEMHEENERLIKKCLQLKREYTDNNQESFTNNKQNCVIMHPFSDKVVVSPQSLLTISCNKIIETIQYNENVSQSVTTSSSKLSLDHENSEYSESPCDCIKLKSELNIAQHKNSQLLKLLEELQCTNESLTNEIEVASEEMKTLMDVTSQLQKKILNHRTNLSTLTATTYAENKSLSSRVKFLEHHHNRFHTVCQRDLPDMKKQLHELMKLLNEESVDKKLNISFKRYSLPIPLDSNSVICSFKNESTLDGDLLMLDTNVTLATSADNTLTDHDQTCHEVTQVYLSNDAACQTPAFWVISELDVSSHDSNHDHSIKVLSEETQKGNELVKSPNCIQKVDISTSPHKLISDKNLTEKNFCENCDHETIQRKQLIQELEEVNTKLADVTRLKDDIEEKYNNLCIEIPSPNLLRKLHNFEKEFENKNNEIEKLSKALKSSKEALKSVQEENDSLSTQIMEFIDEIDDLKKELDNVKKLNLENERDSKVECPKCIQKDQYINELRSKYSNTHTRLNRSYSDSDSSSRYNKICTLQTELDAGREDCNELKEEVSTIKNHLEISNISISQAMDLDESIGTINQAMDLDESIGASNIVETRVNKCLMPKISEELDPDIYTVDKMDCFNYYVEVVGNENAQIDSDIKIKDVMKMLHSKLMIKHSNEIKNHINKLRDYEDSKRELQQKLDNLTKCYEQSQSKVHIIDNKLSLLKNSLKNLCINDSSVQIDFFKDKFLMVLDTEFELNSVTIFDSMLKVEFNKNLNNINETMSKYIALEESSRKLAEELKTANDNLLQLRSKLNDKEHECNLLIAQKAKIHEISNDVAMDKFKKEQDFSTAIKEGYKKLCEVNILISDNIDTTLTPIENLHLLFEQLMKENNPKKVLEKQMQIDILQQEVTSSKIIIENKDKELKILTEEYKKIEHDIQNRNKLLLEEKTKLEAQKSLNEDFSAIYNKKVEENDMNLHLIQELTEEIDVLKENITNKELVIQNLQTELSIHKSSTTESEAKVSKLAQDIKTSVEEINKLKYISQSLSKEKECMAETIEKAEAIIKQYKIDLEKMESEILILNETVKENVNRIDSLKLETESLRHENLHLKEELIEKSKDVSRLEYNIKTHETTAKIQTKMISRLQKQKDDDTNIISEKEKQLHELIQKCNDLQSESVDMKNCIGALQHEIDTLKNIKQSLEERICQLELETQERSQKPRLSIEAITDQSRRRRQSIYDSKRIFDDKEQDHNKVEAVFEGRSKPDDFFMDVDESFSCRSTPVRHSRGRDSLQSKHEESETEGRASRASSAAAARQRRQSCHDLQRAATDSLSEHVHNQSRDKSKQDSPNDEKVNSRVRELQERLSSCQEELEELKERYKELDDECETCAQYLRERDEQCSRLKKEKAALEKTIAELNEKLVSTNHNSSRKNNFVDAAVNTDADWANLYSVVVDRMSYDAELEKNKKLTKTIEELRINKQELKSIVSKMQRALDEKSTKDGRELEKTRKELRACKEELKDLKIRYKELDEECETCAQYLKERDEQCRKLKETIATLEVKLQELQDNSFNVSHSLRRKRRTLHDLNRRSITEYTDASTQICEDFLTHQVERDSQAVTDDTHTKQITRLKMAVEQLSQQKAALEQQLTAATTAPAYVATGSAIVQNQQLTDVMKENQKLKKMNTELITLCRKRSKALIKSNQENQDPAQEI